MSQRLRPEQEADLERLTQQFSQQLGASKADAAYHLRNLVIQGLETIVGADKQAVIARLESLEAECRRS